MGRTFRTLLADTLPRRLFHSVRGRLTLLVIALVAPAFLLVAALMVRAYENERVAVADKLLATSRAVSSLADRELKEFDAILRTLSASRSLFEDDLDSFERIAREALADSGRWIALSDANYQQLVNTLAPADAALPAFPDSADLRETMARGTPYISNLRDGPVANGPVLFVSRPYYRNGELKYILTLLVRPPDFSNAIGITRYSTPSGLVALVDRENRIISRSRDPEIFVGRNISPFMRSLLDGADEGVHDTVTLDGMSVITAFHRGKSSGWVAIVSAPKADLFASARKILWLGLALSAVLLATAGLIAAWILRGLTRGVDSLVAGSEAIARGEPVNFERSGLSEMDFVGSAMSRSALHLRQTSEQLRTTLERLHFSLSSLAIGDWEWNPTGNESILSDQAAAIFGLEPGRGRYQRADIRRVIHPDDLDAVRRTSEEASRSGHVYRAEYRVLHPTRGVRWVAVSAKPIPKSAHEPLTLVGVVQDITELKRAEDFLRTQNDLLEKKVAERTQRLSETIGELEAFSYSISHDMRAPLRSMHSYAKLLESEHAAQLDDTARRYLDRIQANAARLELLVRDVLAYSKVAKEHLETKPVDLDRFVRDLVHQLTDASAPGATIEIAGNLPRALAHEAYLSQIFTNLIGNALKFIAPDTTPRIVISAETHDDTVRIFVRDNGIGIDPADYERIFQIFGRVHPSASYDGTGIGLAIVKKAVQRMGGELGVESAVGTGSTFWFTLRRA